MQKRNKFGRFVKGLIPWNTGLTKETDEKVRKIAEMKIGKKRREGKMDKICLSGFCSVVFEQKKIY